MIYDLRSTFASNALAAGVTVFELARVMGTSLRMIERHHGALLDGAYNGIAVRLDDAKRLAVYLPEDWGSCPPFTPLRTTRWVPPLARARGPQSASA
jgi:hypothetical protein